MESPLAERSVDGSEVCSQKILLSSKSQNRTATYNAKFTDLIYSCGTLLNGSYSYLCLQNLVQQYSQPEVNITDNRFFYFYLNYIRNANMNYHCEQKVQRKVHSNSTYVKRQSCQILHLVNSRMQITIYLSFLLLFANKRP